MAAILTRTITIFRRHGQFTQGVRPLIAHFFPIFGLENNEQTADDDTQDTIVRRGIPHKLRRWMKGDEMKQEPGRRHLGAQGPV